MQCYIQNSHQAVLYQLSGSREEAKKHFCTASEINKKAFSVLFYLPGWGFKLEAFKHMPGRCEQTPILSKNHIKFQ